MKRISINRLLKSGKLLTPKQSKPIDAAYRQDPTLSKLKFSVSLSSESSGTLVIRIIMMIMRGMCKTKLNRQLRYYITMPPSVGPKASPKYTAARVIPIAFPRSFAG